MRRGQHQATAVPGCELGAGPFQVFGFAQDALGNAEHYLARLGDPGKTFAAPLEDGHPQFIFKQLDLLGDTGLRGVERFGRLGDVQALALDFNDITELLEFHFRPRDRVIRCSP
ncbi:hypothetical protein SDC9_204856 [bioreactor metagenome]|uniref:Uncharacterized protein n=1 Tax=bioreactor metagenome TaxID=1076179 RepID=A0A645J224_9ZZZZ